MTGLLLSIMLFSTLTITDVSQDLNVDNIENIVTQKEVEDEFEEVVTLQSPYDENIGILLVDNLQNVTLSNESIYPTLDKSKILDNIIKYKSSSNETDFDYNSIELISEYDDINNSQEEQIDSNIINKINANYISDESIIYGYQNLGVSNTKSYVNVRDEAKDDAFIIGKMPNGCACEIIEESGNFYKIKSGDVEGYVKKEYILTKRDANIKAIETMEEVFVVTSDYATIYNNVNLQEEQMSIPKGGTANIVEKVNSFYKISIDNIEGYILEDEGEVIFTLPTAILLYTPVEKTQKEIVNFALQFLGNPYVWGGTSLTDGCDCSGFVQQIYKEFGYTLNRHSSDQAMQGIEVNLDELEVGDLVFYDHTGAGIDHVGMYIGNGQLIHASNEKDGIKINNVFYIKPVKAIRILTEETVN